MWTKPFEFFSQKGTEKTGCVVMERGAEDDKPCGPSRPTSRYHVPPCWLFQFTLNLALRDLTFQDFINGATCGHYFTTTLYTVMGSTTKLHFFTALHGFTASIFASPGLSNEAPSQPRQLQGDRRAEWMEQQLPEWIHCRAFLFVACSAT
jgi:hypothetical protein